MISVWVGYYLDRLFFQFILTIEDLHHTLCKWYMQGYDPGDRGSDDHDRHVGSIFIHVSIAKSREIAYLHKKKLKIYK